jgi:GTP pyrophosphokinase
MLTDRFRNAMDMAFELHQDQKKKGSGTPYVGHLLGVTATVLEHGGTEDEAIAALLHDAIEDQGGPQARLMILERFGEAVTAIVDGCTDTDRQPKPPWLERKQKYLAHMRHPSPSVRLVSMADKLNNVRAIQADYRAHGESLWGRFKGGRDGTLWYYRSYVDIANQYFDASPLLDELSRAVSEFESAVKDFD